MIDSRVEIFVMVAISRLKLDVSAPQSLDGRMGLIVFLMKTVVTALLEWLKERIRFEGVHREDFYEVALYRFLSMFLFSQSREMSQEARTALFTNLRFTTSSSRMSAYIGSKVLSFRPTSWNRESSVTWRSQRDTARLLNDFELQASSASN